MSLPASLILELALIGIVIGGIYALVGVGLTLVYGVLEVINVAHGALAILGAYLAFTVSRLQGQNALSALLVAMLLVFLVGAAIDQGLFVTLRSRGQFNPDAVLVITFALGMVLENSLTVVWGHDPVKTPPLLEGGVSLLGVPMSLQRLVSFSTAITVILGMFVCLKTTWTGKAIRAVSENAEAGWSLGINVHRIYWITLGVGAAMAAGAGALVASMFWVNSPMAFSYSVKSFVIIVLGGMGSFLGALLGGFVLGLAESLAIVALGSAYKDAVGLLIMVLVLLLRPQGLLGVK
jgi:branched-chain amino acid transport system permease protein